MLERSRRVSAPAVFRALWRQEQAGSTAVGNALAIPHARVAGITEPATAYVRLKEANLKPELPDDQSDDDDDPSADE